jgi:hypothetical protein
MLTSEEALFDCQSIAEGLPIEFSRPANGDPTGKRRARLRI